NAPASVKAAADEFMFMFQKSTGVQLSLIKDNQQTNKPFISLGSTKQARAANIILEKLEDDGFRILTKNNNIFIVGTDTPDGQWTEGGGTSSGTANGIYTFLEDYLDARW